MPSRESKVMELVNAATEGMARVVDDATANEVFSAHLTLMNAILQAAKEAGTPIETLRAGVDRLYLGLDDPGKKAS